MEVVVRGGTPNDLSFIMSTYLRGLRHGSAYFQEIEKTAYYELQGAEFSGLLKKPQVSIRVAVLKDDTDVILGYAILGWQDKPILHWVYVKSAFRKQNIAKQLLEGADVDTVTNITDLGNEIRKSKKWKFNPFLGG